ncbi:DNA cytosine methyltransferase [Streptomyces bluensis]|uniref:DNA cytosine methyltransferase n=1 Tax=Streptomyces bluensis TaxID=33897 RepID=UPI00332CD3F0
MAATDLPIGSLFSGVGGLDLGVQAALGGHIAWHAETDPHAAHILTRHWPDAPNLGDVGSIDWRHVEPVDVLTRPRPLPRGRSGAPAPDPTRERRGQGLAPSALPQWRTHPGLHRGHPWCRYAESGMAAAHPDHGGCQLSCESSLNDGQRVVRSRP